jgi:hypothetical protein
MAKRSKKGAKGKPAKKAAPKKAKGELRDDQVERAAGGFEMYTPAVDGSVTVNPVIANAMKSGIIV